MTVDHDLVHMQDHLRRVFGQPLEAKTKRWLNLLLDLVLRTRIDRSLLVIYKPRRPMIKLLGCKLFVDQFDQWR